MKTQLNLFAQASIWILAIVLGGYVAAQLMQAQSGGLRRESGIIFSKGDFIARQSGAAVSAGDALYLDSNGKVQKLTAAEAANAIGVAYNTVTAANKTVYVQMSGIATVVADGAVSTGAKVGGTGLTTAGRVAALSSTLAVSSGSTTVTSTAANGSIVTGDTPTSRVLGRALTAASQAGDSINILVLPQ